MAVWLITAHRARCSRERQSLPSGVTRFMRAFGLLESVFRKPWDGACSILSTLASHKLNSRPACAPYIYSTQPIELLPLSKSLRLHIAQPCDRFALSVDHYDFTTTRGFSLYTHLSANSVLRTQPTLSPMKFKLCTSISDPSER